MVDIKNFKYYKISLSLIPKDIIYKYNLVDNQINSFIYIRLEKGMHGLVQYVIISHPSLKEHLLPFGYEHAPITPVLWCHKKNG